MEDSNENKVVVNTPDGRMEHMTSQYEKYAQEMELDEVKAKLFNGYAKKLCVIPFKYMYSEYVPSANWFSFDMNLGDGILLNCTFEALDKGDSKVYFSLDKDGHLEFIDWSSLDVFMEILKMYLGDYGVEYES